MNNYKFKLIIFILLLLFLFVILYYGLFGFSVSYLTEEEIKINRKENDNLISFFEINDIETVYDKENDVYYYSVPDKFENKKYTLKLELDNQYKYKIVNYATNIITVDYSKDYQIIIYNDEYYYETTIRLTNLPLINITTDTEITDNETNSTFKYINPSNLDRVVTYNSKINIRGATTRRYNKKSYKIKMYDNDYDKEKNINISNFYYGSSFILDAMYRDHSKIRNILAMQIWNSFSDDFTNEDIYSEYVEVFVNGKYVGVYAFTEPINRKNLNLNKSTLNDTSVIIKSNDWIVINKKNSISNITDDTYLGYELKYPNDENLFSVSWEKILSKLSKYYISMEQTKYEDLNEIFDINNYIDLVIFNSFINNRDNALKKNNYFYLKDLNSKINIHPWDMEFCFGLNYKEDEEYDFIKNMDDYNNIVFDIFHDSNKINSLLINRYWNLRRSVLNENYLDDLLDKYLKDLNKGAAKRDSKLWLDYDIENEIEEIRTWLHKRLAFYDNYIRGLENE